MISVIVPARNEQARVGACLQALLAQEGVVTPMEIVVVDDASTDGTAAVVTSFSGTDQVAVVLERGPGRGVSAARNAGAARARGELLLFTDADCRPLPGWAAALVAAVRRPGVSGATGRQQSDQRQLVARLVQAEVDEKHARLAVSARVTFADTASAAYRADAFRAAGGFDEGLANFEDTELAFRLARAGHRLVVAPEAVVRHGHVTSLLDYARRKRRIGFWGAAVYRAHPGKVLDDSRTPWTMRAQMLLAPPLGLALGACLVAPAARLPALALAAAFLATAVPYARLARRQGVDALLAAPLLLLVRGLALDAGLLEGLARLAVGTHPAQRAPRPEGDAARELPLPRAEP